MPRFTRFITNNIATGNACVGVQIGGSGGYSSLRGQWDASNNTLTYACPACGGEKTHRGLAFVNGIVEDCGCGNHNDVTA